MIDPSMLREQSPRCYSDISQNQDNDEGTLTQRVIDDKIRAMSPRDALDAFLVWNGIIGYTDQIIDAVHAIQVAHNQWGRR